MTIQDQLKAYAEYVEVRVDAIELDELRDLSSRTPPVRMVPETGRSAPRRLVVAFVAAAAVTIAVIIPLIFLRGDAEPDVATTLPNTTLGAPTTTIAQQPAAPDRAVLRVAELPPHYAAGWSWVDTGLDTSVLGRFSDGRWYAFDAGWDCYTGGQYFSARDGGCDDGNPDANPIVDPVESLLISTDGTNWDSEDVAEFSSMVVNGDIHGGGPIFATAWPTGVEPSQAPQTHWMSTDGRDWHQIVVNAPEVLANDPAFEFGALHIVHSSVRSGQTIVSLTGCRTSGVVAVSLDNGLTWSIVDGIPGTGSPAIFGPCDQSRTNHHELFTIGGVFHALSYPTDVDDPTLFRSGNGTDWELVGETSGLAPWAKRRDGGTPAPIDVGSFALGVRHNEGFGTRPAATFVVSNDGLIWTEVEVPQCGFGAPEASLGPSLAHRSADGSTWIMITPCGSGDEGYVLGHSTGEEFAWYRVVPPSDLTNATVYGTENVVMARAGSVWVAIPPE